MRNFIGCDSCFCMVLNLQNKRMCNTSISYCAGLVSQGFYGIWPCVGRRELRGQYGIMQNACFIACMTRTFHDADRITPI